MRYSPLRTGGGGGRERDIVMGEREVGRKVRGREV